MSHVLIENNLSIARYQALISFSRVQSVAEVFGNINLIWTQYHRIDDYVQQVAAPKSLPHLVWPLDFLRGRI